MAKSRNSYSKGLNKDNSRSKYDPSSYYDALNIKIMTSDGLSTGSIENEDGNALSFVVPDLSAETNVCYLDGTAANVPAQNNLQIIGWTTLENLIVLFTTAETVATPSGSYGQIWTIEYDEANDTIIGILPGNLLDPTVHLRYNQQLNFSSYHRIEAVGRYENVDTLRVYWTDFNSPLRVANLSSTADPLLRDVTAPYPTGKITTIDPANTDLKPNATFGRSTPTAVGLGSLPAAGKVQYAYRLLSKDGAETLISPASELVSLTVDIPNTGDIPDLEGANSNTANAKSVTFEITNIDTNYDVIEHIAILYIDKDAPSIFKFGEENIPPSGTASPPLVGGNDVFSNRLSVTLTGAEDRIYLTQVEYSTINTGFDTCKSIDAKDNRLIAGNIKTQISEIPDSLFDARAYRFNSSRDALITDVVEGPITIQGAAPNWNVLDTHDAINSFNDENPVTNPGWTTVVNQYKYQDDGVTLGGTGPKISYEFSQFTATAGEMVVDNASTSNPAFTHIRNAPFINVKPVNGEWPNMANPIKEARTMGYMRGEVYRFGIEFYDLKGRPTFVKWIGDIKFPDPTHGQVFKVGDTGSMTIDDMRVYSMGIRFDVDVSSVRHLISGYQIVRVEREAQDRTRLGTGTILLPVDKQDENTDWFQDTLFESVIAEHNEKVGVYEMELKGKKNETDRFVLPDCPGIRAHAQTVINNPSTKGAAVFLSPVSTYRADTGFAFQEGDYLKTYGYYQALATQYVNWTPSGISNDDLKRQGWVWKARDFQSVNHATSPAYESFKINFFNHLEDGEIVEKTSTKLPSGLAGNKFLNNSYGVVTTGTSDENAPFGMGRDICLMELAPTATGHTNAAAMAWNTVQPSTVTAGKNTDGEYSVNAGHTFKEVGYCRQVVAQYGGDTHEVRSKQKYISTSHYQPIRAVGSLPPSGVVVFGGDTYVNYWDREYMQQYWNDTYQNRDSQWGGSVDYKQSTAILFPTESIVNTDLAYGTTFAKDRKGDTYSLYIETVNREVEEVYTQESNASSKFFSKDFLLSTNEEFQHRLWASDKKVDGEFLDSWRSFKENNFIEVEGGYGPINKVINFQDKLLYYQDRAFGIGSINERSMITDASNVQVAVGTGSILDHFRYISTTTGSFHQFGVVNSGTGVYHYDSLLNKMYRFNQSGIAPLTDLKGMSSFFHEEIQGEIIDTDLTVRNLGVQQGLGIHGVYDFRHNRVLFTFLRNSTNPLNPDFTISFSEALDSFESLYSYTPNLYLTTGGRTLSIDKTAPNTPYLHDAGVKGVFYDKAVVESSITILIAPEADLPKVFNNIEYNSEIFLKDVNGDYTDSQHLDTLSTFEYYNDYQSSGVIPLIVGANVKRRMRHWRHTMIRDQSSTNQRARFRDYHIFLKLTYDNNNDKRLVLHDMITSYMPARD